MGILSAFLIGCAKTGLPSLGILTVPLMAEAFGGRASAGAVLPMLVFADIFAVAWYKRHARWDKLRVLIPWVMVGVAIGGLLLDWMTKFKMKTDPLGPIIGWVTLALLGLHLVKLRFPDKFSLKSHAATAVVGASAGVATTVANAAGPITGIYLTSIELPKEVMMGTGAWFYCLINLVKVPLFAFLTKHDPLHPLFTTLTLKFDFAIIPFILCGAFFGKWLLQKVPQKAFDLAILVLSALAAINLLIPHAK